MWDSNSYKRKFRSSTQLLFKSWTFATKLPQLLFAASLWGNIVVFTFFDTLDIGHLAREAVAGPRISDSRLAAWLAHACGTAPLQDSECGVGCD